MESMGDGRLAGIATGESRTRDGGGGLVTAAGVDASQQRLAMQVAVVVRMQLAMPAKSQAMTR